VVQGVSRKQYSRHNTGHDVGFSECIASGVWLSSKVRMQVIPSNLVRVMSWMANVPLSTWKMLPKTTLSIVASHTSMTVCSTIILKSTLTSLEFTFVNV
jgi:hypothetical protein